jgi:HK97 family phage major capsid protein
MNTRLIGAAPRALCGVVRADASDPKAMIGQLQAAFEAFKTANDEKISAAKADVLNDEKVVRIDDAVTALQAEIDKVNAAMAARQIGGGQQEVRDPEYNTAFAGYVQKGSVQAALNKGADDEGGYLTPVEWDRTINDKLVEISPMRQLATVRPIGGSGYKTLFNMRGTGSGWVGETALRPETSTPEFAPLAFAFGEIYANPAATQQMLDDSEINLEQWLAGEVNTEFGYQEGLAFVSGNGTNKPNGFLTYATGAANAATHPLGAIQVTTAASATAVTTDELLDVIYSVPGQLLQNARWTMNRLTMSKIRKLKDADGNYLWQPSLAAGEPAALMGFPVTDMAAMPNATAGALPIAFGDFRRGYLILDRMGVRVLRDPYTNKPYVMFYTTKRVGGGVQDPTVLRAVKMAA